MLQSVQKATQVLRLFSHEHPVWSVTEVAHELGVAKSSASELLSTLAEGGLLQRVGSGRYRPGWLLFELGQAVLDSTELLPVARPVMETLVAGWGETVHLAVLLEGQVLYIDKRQGDRAAEILLSRIGRRLPAHCSGVGKVLLASRPAAEIEAIVAQRGLPPLTPNTITRVDRLQDELSQVRQQGYAYDQEEIAVGLCCAAAPIRDADGTVVAAMSLSVPAYRFYPQQPRLTTAVIQAARRVSEGLGYIPRKEQLWRDGSGFKPQSLALATSERT